MKRYLYFDHIIASDMEVPELPDGEGHDRVASVMVEVSQNSAEFNCSRDWLHHWRSPEGSIIFSFSRTGDSIYLHFPELACFAISSCGRQVSCSAKPATPAAVIRHLLLDQVLPRLFAHFFDYAVFHACCLTMQGHGICFLGDTGWGKSTIAAGFSRAGCTVLTDDCLHLAVTDKRVVGRPSYNGIRLLPDSFEAFGFPGSNRTQEKIEKNADYIWKKRMNLGPEKTAATTVQAIFLLTAPEEDGKCTKPELIPTSRMTAVKELLKNSFILDVHDHHYLKNQFRHLTELAASTVSFYTLRYPRTYQSFPELVAAVGRVL